MKEGSMSTRVLKRSILALLLSLSGCMQVDTNAHPIFHELKEEVSLLTNQEIYWDSCISDSFEEISVHELLEEPLDENQVIRIALLNNQKLQAAYEELGIAKAGLAQAGIWKNPIFSFSYRFSTQSNVTDLIDMGLIQNFLDILLIPLKKKMAKAELDIVKTSLIANVLDTIAEARIAYYAFQAAEKIWQLKHQILLATDLSYQAADLLYKAGNLTDLQVDIERSYFEQAKLDVASWEKIVWEAREKLNLAMGLWGRQIEWEVATDFSRLPSMEDDVSGIENTAIKKSLDLKIANYHLMKTASSYGIDTTRMIFPEFDLGASSEREDSIWYVGPAFNIPLPFFDFGIAANAKAHSAIMKEWRRYTALAVEIRSKARSSKISYQNAYRQAKYFEKVVVPLAEEITQKTLLQHNAMQMGVFDLLSAKRVELEKKVHFAELEREYWNNKVILQLLIDGHIFEKRVGENL